MTETNQETNQDGKPGLRARFTHQSLPKKITTGLLAVAAAITTLWGAGQAVNGLLGILSEARVEGNEVNLTPNLGLEFWQAGAQNDMLLDEQTGTVRVSMKSEAFELRFPKEGFPTGTELQLVAWTNDSVLDVRPGTKTGDFTMADYEKRPEDLASPFHEGKRMATNMFGLGTLILSNEAYNGISEAEFASQSTAKYKRTYVAIWNTQERVLLTKWKKDIFLTVFIDLNKDLIMDRGEYERIILDFRG